MPSGRRPDAQLGNPGRGGSGAPGTILCRRIQRLTSRRAPGRRHAMRRSRISFVARMFEARDAPKTTDLTLGSLHT